MRSATAAPHRHEKPNSRSLIERLPQARGQSGVGVRGQRRGRAAQSARLSKTTRAFAGSNPAPIGNFSGSPLLCPELSLNGRAYRIKLSVAGKKAIYQ